ncbi:MAG: sulfatase-like hydrolase/transferase [Thioploca sp.]|nr:sulfatase-like hydrolase/transferase [Thioploca sp.]
MLNKDHSLLLTLLINLGLSLLVLPFLAQAEMVEHVIIISFDGLRPDALTILGTNNLPAFYKVIQEGASTLNARSDYDKTETLPNHATMLTGQGVMGPNGHKHDMNTDTGQTLHSVKGSYVSSFFDVAHDYGLKTALLASKDKFAVYSRSYDETNGALDLIDEDNGRDKIDIVALTEKVDSITLTNFISTINSSPPPHLTFLHFCGPDKTGHTSTTTGWDVTLGSAYMNTIKQMDDYLQQVLDNVPPKTVVIVTADHGGGETSSNRHDIPDKIVNYTIPFLVWDNIGISQPNSDLYSLNTNDYLDPGTGRPNYDQVQQPIRNGDVANLALSLLCLPNIPGSFIKGKLALNNYTNRAPSIANSSTPNLTPINEDDINNTGIVVADLITGLITDPDFSCTLEGIAVIAIDNSNGHWEYSIDSGLIWNPFGNPSPNDARLLASDTQIRFVPNTNYYGQASITFRAWDQTSGSHGSTADTTISGDPTAFSRDTVIANITVNAVNDAPSFTAGSNLQVAGSSGIQTISQWATAINSGAANENSQNLAFQITITSDPEQILATVPTIDNNTGDFRYALTGNSGTSLLKVVLQDDGGTASGGIDTSSPTAFTITVSDTPNPHSTHPQQPTPTTPNLNSPTLPSTPGLQPLPRTMTLAISLRGNGKGRVTTDPQGIDCDNDDDTCEQVYETASWVKLTPIAAPGSKFSSWGGHSDCENSEVFMSGQRRCEAYFDLLPVTLTITPINNATITSYPQGINCSRHGEQCSHLFSANTKVTLIVTPAVGWQLAGWEGDCDETGQITLMADKQCQPILVSIPVAPISTEVKKLDETMPLMVTADTVLEKTLITITDEATVTLLPAETSITTGETTAVIIEKAALPSNSTTPTIASTVVTSIPFGKPICPTAGWLDWVCNAQKQTIAHLEIGPNGNLSNGILAETINSQGWTSNLVIQPQATLTGGIVTGYIENQGTMTDFIFRGALIQGGILAGTIMNDSPIGGVIKDIQLAAGTYLSGGHWGGNIIGEANAPAWLEHLTIVTGSYLNHVVIGEEVELAKNVTLGENVHFISVEE